MQSKEDGACLHLPPGPTVVLSPDTVMLLVPHFVGPNTKLGLKKKKHKEFGSFAWKLTHKICFQIPSGERSYIS